MSEEFVLDLTVDRSHLHDALKGLICTIFFYRTFGLITPKSYEFLEVNYPFVDIAELEEVIDSKIEALETKLDKDESIEEEPEDLNASFTQSLNSSVRSNTPATSNSSTNIKQITIMINFYETKKLKKPSWFSKVEEDIIFEKWYINLKILNNRIYEYQSDKFNINLLQQNFENLIWKISEYSNQNKNHIPIITSLDILPFNYTISIKKPSTTTTSSSTNSITNTYNLEGIYP